MALIRLIFWGAQDATDGSNSAYIYFWAPTSQWMISDDYSKQGWSAKSGPSTVSCPADETSWEVYGGGWNSVTPTFTCKPKYDELWRQRRMLRNSSDCSSSVSKLSRLRSNLETRIWLYKHRLEARSADEVVRLG